MPNAATTSSRRRLLQAAGLTLSLPALASLGDLPFVKSVRAGEGAAEPSATQSPKRFCCIVFPNGVSLPPQDHPSHHDWHWFPHETGRDYQLTETLKPLSHQRDQISILSGLSHPAFRQSIAHITADSFLTGADSSKVYTNSISLDQIIARKFGVHTRFPSLTLSSDGGVGSPGRTQTLSFSAAGRPIPSLSSPREIFNRLFGVSSLSIEQQRLSIGRRRSILDNVLEETAAIQAKVSPSDRSRLDEYTTSVREIEQRLSRADDWLDTQRPQVDESDFDLTLSPQDDAEQYIRVIFDLMYVALLTDSTRSITYQITSEDAKGIGDRFPNSIGLPGHHALSHGTAKDKGYENWSRYDRFLSHQLAYFIRRLRESQDAFGQGSLLDNTVVLYGCGTSDTHRAENYPLILAGGQSMGFTHGQHRAFDSSQYRLSDLYVTLLQQMGIHVDKFADSTRTIDQVLA